MFNKNNLKLYFICGTQDIDNNSTIIDVVTEALESGITMFQFREKGTGALTGNAKEDLARKLLALCRDYKVPFIVNDDVDLANKINADGIHVGQEDMDINVFAEQFKGKIIGLSISNIAEYEASNLSHVNYIGVGPMFATTSKDDASLPVGPQMITTLRNYIKDFPIVAIGGINLDNVRDIMQAGADGISVISAITQSGNISNTVSQFLQNVE
ncbi:thiamine phosphate synthase [Staphylococcus edaphicus]|uniref:Thiamine-phosphate synthase n=1 Tax=Staphylococcus edaphicus TaxID=1955013 RepID=A0A2C6WKB8_9STAP|nr:thiamine phosphate synthase [Staphylococcus edaphicus]PHK48603.1 thiamine phosphate synthase [Staphylococcus edaphicus]UQW82316.1 thiamine phosphate synthase [Staphylococcus edaphicus]